MGARPGTLVPEADLLLEIAVQRSCLMQVSLPSRNMGGYGARGGVLIPDRPYPGAGPRGQRPRE